jgi:hypothetical protein
MLNHVERGLVITINQIHIDVMELMDDLESNDIEGAKQVACNIHNCIAECMSYIKIREESNG